MEDYTPKVHTHENYTYILNEQTNSITITDYKGRFKNITIPSEIDGKSVTEIGSFAFENNYLRNITIPASVTKIGDAAFTNNQLRNITIPTSVTTISWAAFANNQLTKITIPASITKIGDFAFENNQLTTVTIPNSVTEIGRYAFYNNPHLRTIIIPDRTIIAKDTFDPSCQIIRHSDQNKLIAELLTKKHNSTQPPG